MIDINSRFIIYFNSSNLSRACNQFTNDIENITQETTDALYLITDTPVRNFYVDIPTPNESQATIKIELSTSTGWQRVTDIRLIDNTNGFKRSGFISINPDDLGWQKDSYEDATGFIMKITFDIDIEYSLNGFGIIFSDDNELKKEYNLISSSDFLLGASSHLLTHIAVRDSIVQQLNNQGINKLNNDRTLAEGITRINALNKRLTPFDLYDIFEVRLAATYYAMCRIFNQVSDNPDDSWKVKSREYCKKGDEYLRLAFLSLFDELNERKQKQAIGIVRMLR